VSHAHNILAAQARVAAGRAAHAAGQPRHAPYGMTPTGEPHTQHARQWIHGWDSAAQGDPWTCWLTDDIIDLDTATTTDLRTILDTLGAPTGTITTEPDTNPRIRQWRVTVTPTTPPTPNPGP
jgi:hypothetical protein